MGQWSVKQMFTSAPRFDQSQLLTTEQYSTSVNTDGQWNVNHLITSTQSQPLTTTSYDRHSMTGDSQGMFPTRMTLGTCFDTIHGITFYIASKDMCNHFAKQNQLLLSTVTL